MMRAMVLCVVVVLVCFLLMEEANATLISYQAIRKDGSCPKKSPKCNGKQVANPYTRGCEKEVD
uniref:Uncharacterized protein n=1 Tax=Nelumbo nucifera TaxID=4432 RepID=A0A822XNM9_NELNU|nr:TPA_asm: hypothetical protein HUJ06_021818 [Nelumbo nucifera]